MTIKQRTSTRAVQVKDEPYDMGFATLTTDVLRAGWFGLHEIDMGHYVGVSTPVLSGIECPYCREQLYKATDVQFSIGRIVRVVDRQEAVVRVLAEQLPDTHEALGCMTCHLGFTVLKASADVDALA